jgi:hypothetical protein
LFFELFHSFDSYARSIIKASAATARKHSRIKSWKPLTINELKKFLAIVFNMGLLKKNINRGVLEYYNPYTCTGTNYQVFWSNQHLNNVK